jgi:hypothetical protein
MSEVLFTLIPEVPVSSTSLGKVKVKQTPCDNVLIVVTSTTHGIKFSEMVLLNKSFSENTFSSKSLSL